MRRIPARHRRLVRRLAGLLAFLACLPLIYGFGRIVYTDPGARTIAALLIGGLGVLALVTASPDNHRK